jgi:hypothetical protein
LLVILCPQITDNKLQYKAHILPLQNPDLEARQIWVVQVTLGLPPHLLSYLAKWRPGPLLKTHDKCTPAALVFRNLISMEVDPGR